MGGGDTHGSFWQLCFPKAFFFSSRRRDTRLQGDWSSDVCSSDLVCMTPPSQGDCCAAGLVQTLLYVLPVSGYHKRWYAGQSLTRDLCRHRVFPTSKPSPSTKACTYGLTRTSFSCSLVRQRRMRSLTKTAGRVPKIAILERTHDAATHVPRASL